MDETAKVTNISTINAPQEGFSLQPKTLDEAMAFSAMICESSFCPKAFKGKAGDVLVAVQMGGEIGLQPMQALQNIAVINSRPCVWGDALPALAMANPNYESMDETFDDETMTATCKIKRRGGAEQVVSFSQADAVTAKLWGKDGPWTEYPKRMLAMRARGWAIRNVFPDSLKGISVAEEVRDTPKDMGRADVVGESAAHKVVEPEQTLLPVYPGDKFDASLAGWKELFVSKKSSPEHLINTISSKYTLTDDQIKQIKEEK